MKRKVLLAIFAASSLFAMAQHEVGTWSIMPRLGYLWSGVTNDEDTKGKSALVFGVDAEYTLNNRMGLQIGLQYSDQGFDVKYGSIAANNSYMNNYMNYMYGYGSGYYNNYESNYSVNEDACMSLKYIGVPIIAKFYIYPGVSINLGLQPAVNISSKLKYLGNSMNWNDIAGNGSKINTFDFSIPVGMSYEALNLVLDFRYNIGVSKVISISEGKNWAAQISLGYKFDME